MRCTSSILFFCGLLLAATPLAAQDGELLRREVDKLVYLDAQINYERTPGFIIGVIWGDSTYFLTYGSISRDTSLAPDPNSIFEIGELGHIFAAELLLQEVAAGKLDPDAPLPDWPEEYPEITLDDFLTHRSGLPRFLPEFGQFQEDAGDPYAQITDAILADFLREFDASCGSYGFSNFNYSIPLQHLASRRDAAFSDWIRTNLLLPKGLNQTTCGVLPDSLLVTGYDKSGEPVSPWSESPLYPATGFKSSASDLCKFLRYLLEEDRFSALLPRAVKTDIRDNTRATWGWHILRLRKYYPIFVQSGSTSGYRAYAAVVPETRTAVVVLSNSPYGLNGLGFMTLRMLNNYWKKRK